MNGDEFWALIDATRPAEPDPDVHAQAITRALAAEGAGATVAFQRHFDAAHDALYRWDVWGAIYLLRGGCSDDSFDYARAWMVGEGRATWERVAADPEAWAVTLVDDVVANGEELSECLQERGFDDAESLLYAAGTAHEQLTGEWTPVDPDRVVGEPAGEEWDEDQVEAAFHRLAAALARAEEAGAVAGSGGSGPDVTSPVDAALRLAQAMDEADDAWSSGDHPSVVGILTAVLDDPSSADLAESVGLGDAFEVTAYQGGMSRLIGGDPDGAARWLRLVASRPEVSRTVVRGLAQIELALGDLDECERLLDVGEGATAMDLGIVTLVAGYRGDGATVMERGRATYDQLVAEADEMHPWDVAGVNLLLGTALVEVGEGAAALTAANNAVRLVEDAPPELPLGPQALIVAAGAHRLEGDLDTADRMLSAAWDRLQPGTSDMGAAQREAARCYRAAGHPTQAKGYYDQAIATFQAAGERWQAGALEREAAGLA